MDRNQLRQELRLRRAAANQQNPDAAQKLAQRFQTITLPANAVSAGYVAVRDEIDPANTMQYLSAQGIQLSLPVVLSDQQPLEFREYNFGDALNAGNAFKIPEPTADKSVVTPVIILVPLLGFDRTGHRLGSGKGLYDRTIAHLRADRAVIAIGMAFAEQEIPKMRAEKHDQRLNIIVTPREVIYCPQ